MGSGGSKNKQQAPVNAQIPRDYYQDPSQRALGNVTHSMPPKQQNTMKEQMPPPITTGPIRQQTQPLPVQANPLPKQQMQQSQSNQAIHQPVQSDSPQSQMQRQPTFAPKKVVQEQEEAQEYDDSPNTLFLFDFQEKVFYYYNTVTSEWKYNDLTSAMDNCPRCPLMKYRLEGEESTAIQFAKYMSYIALSDDLVYLIGGYNSFFSCLVYNIKKNSFFTRSPINVCRNNPSLCRFNGYIYAVSGDQIDSYSTDVSVYDAQNDEWNALPELPYPQGLSSACVIYGKKLAVLGGLTLKFPKTYSPLLSIYTFGQRDWEVFDLTKVLTQRIPRFINSAMIQNREGDLIILGCEGTKFVHKFDLENLQIATCGRLPEEDSFSLQMRSKEALYRNNLVFCLSHKLDMKVYQGYLTLEKWETI